MKEFDNDQLWEKKIDSQEMFDGVLLHLFRDQVELADGSRSVREIIRLLGAVAVVAVTEEGEVLVEKQFRYPLNRIVTEIPAGKLDSLEEEPLEAAKRELAEETGYQADTWIELGIYQPSPAYCEEKILLYLARDLKEGQQKLEDGEFLNVEKIPLSVVVEEVMQGKIQDGKTQVAILKAARFLSV